MASCIMQYEADIQNYVDNWHKPNVKHRRKNQESIENRLKIPQSDRLNEEGSWI